MRAGNTADSLRPKQVEEGVSGTQRVQIDPEWVNAEFSEMATDTEYQEEAKELVGESIHDATDEVDFDLYTIIEDLTARVADLEARATLYNVKASHKF